MAFVGVDLIITRRCNLSCKYCYIKDKDSYKEEDEVVKNIKACDWILAQYRKQFPKDPLHDRRILQIELYGGEPLLAWDSVKAIVEWKNKVEDIIVDLFLVSNMVLLDKEKRDFLHTNKVTIRPSVDGCKEVIDTYRLKKDGSSVADIIYENTKALLKYSPYRICRSTFMPDTVKYLFKSIKFLVKELGFAGVAPMLAGGVEWKDLDLVIVKEQWRQTVDWWIQELREGRCYYLYYMTTMLKGIIPPRICGRPCFSGLTFGAIDIDGDIYPCHRFCNKDTLPEYRMGNIYKDGVVNFELQDRLAKFNLKEFQKKNCGDCIAKPSCSLLCLHDSMLHNKDIYEPPEYYCKIIPFFYSEAQRAHEILDREQNELYYKNFKPRIIESKRS